MDSRVCPINPNPSSYTSAPSSPGRGTSPTLKAYFFSVPTSPSRSRDPSGLESDPRTPGSDGFEFVSLEFPRGYDDDGYHQDIPIMAYADELFRGGKMLPLKLPPRLQSAANSYRKWSGSSNGRMISSTASSPGSRSLRFKLPFQRRSLWSSEFDPFVTALEKVKENGLHHHHHNLPRRSRSLSPLKWGWGLRRSKSLGPNGPAEEMMGNLGRQIKPTTIELMRPGPKGGDKAEDRRQKIKRFLVKSASFGWKMNGLGKEECRTALHWNSHESRRALEAPGARHGSAVVRISRGIKSLVKHRPRLFCRNFGLQHVPKMNRE